MQLPNAALGNTAVPNEVCGPIPKVLQKSVCRVAEVLRDQCHELLVTASSPLVQIQHY